MAIAIHRQASRFHVRVLGVSPQAVVSHLGGWLFDQSMAGWLIDVWTRDEGNPRAMRILGAVQQAGMVEESDLGAAPMTACTLAIDADLYATDDPARLRVQHELGRCPSEVILWGPSAPEVLRPQSAAVVHHCSAAALVFKAHALAAVRAVAGHVEHDEHFRKTKTVASCARLLQEAYKPTNRMQSGRPNELPINGSRPPAVVN